MVDALRRAHRIVTPDGCVIDMHPTASAAWVEVAGTPIGRVDAGDAPLRHAAAAAALKTIVDERRFDVAAAVDFDFYTYGDTIEELRDYIVGNWRNARIDETTLERCREALRAAPGVRPRVLERVRLTTLRPTISERHSM